MQGNEILKTENSHVESSDSNHAHGMQCIPFRLFIKEVVTFSVQIVHAFFYEKDTFFHISFCYCDNLNFSAIFRTNCHQSFRLSTNNNIIIMEE